MTKPPRVAAVVLPLLRDWFDLDGVTVGTWVSGIDRRKFPLINVRRLGGYGRAEISETWQGPIRSTVRPLGRAAVSPFKATPKGLAYVVIELTAYGSDGLAETEDLYDTALDALYDAVSEGTQETAGFLWDIKETMGSTEFESPYTDSWRIQGLIQLGVCPPRYPEESEGDSS